MSLERPAEQTAVLFVCTANQCRSPFAEAIARRYLDDRFAIGSAGLIAGGHPVPQNGLVVASELGIDLRSHVSHQADLHDLRSWDVILTMTRGHIRELLAADAALWPRVFTIKQFRRWIQSQPPSTQTDIGAWIDDAAADRSRIEAVGVSVNDDIEDPVRSPVKAWRKMAAEMDSELSAALGQLKQHLG